MINIDKLTSEELWKLFGKILKKLRESGEMRTKNITGERGEQLAINYYNKTKNLAKLQAAPTGTKNIDAISRDGDRYAIKSMMLPGKTTGVFWGMGTPNKPIEEKKFEFLIIVVINDLYELEKILEIDWKTFWKFKKWHSTMKSFNISISKIVEKNSKVIYKK